MCVTVYGNAIPVAAVMTHTANPSASGRGDRCPSPRSVVTSYAAINRAKAFPLTDIARAPDVLLTLDHAATARSRKQTRWRAGLWPLAIHEFVRIVGGGSTDSVGTLANLRSQYVPAGNITGVPDSQRARASR